MCRAIFFCDMYGVRLIVLYVYILLPIIMYKIIQVKEETHTRLLKAKLQESLKQNGKQVTFDGVENILLDLWEQIESGNSTMKNPKGKSVCAVDLDKLAEAVMEVSLAFHEVDTKVTMFRLHTLLLDVLKGKYECHAITRLEAST